MKHGYDVLAANYALTNAVMPKNKHGRSETDLLLRNLDCAVIQMVHRYNEEMGLEAYDSIRGLFTEGGAVYPGSCFTEKTHVQLCIVNPNCIKGYFAPMPYNSEYRIP